MRRLRVVKTVIVLAALVPWLLGFYAVFFVSAQYTGLGLSESYLTFQGGSNLGNVIWFGVWTGSTATISWVLVRRIGRFPSARRVAAFTLIAYAVPALLLIFPVTTMGFAVAHVRAFTNEQTPYSTLALFLVQSGTVALALGTILSAADYVLGRKSRALPS